MVRTALERGLVEGLPAFEKRDIKAEITIEESRFDFRCSKDGISYYVEVKGVPCACIEDTPLSPKKKAQMMDTINKLKQLPISGAELLFVMPTASSTFRHL